MLIDRTGTRLDNGDGIYGKVSVPDPNRSGHSMSYKNTFSGHLGMLYPSFWKLVYPSDEMDFSSSVNVQFAPLVNPIFENLEVCCEYFYVPLSMVDPCWKNFITGKPQPLSINRNVPLYPLTMGPNRIGTTAIQVQGLWNTYGSLLDYFGYGTPSGDILDGSLTTTNMPNIRCSAYPWLAYWRVIADWYTNHSTMDLEGDPNYSVAFPYATTSSAWQNPKATTPTDIRNFSPASSTPVHTSKPFTRMYDRDFLSTATLKGSMSNMPQVAITNGTSPNPDYFELSTFRMASALTKFAERENLTGSIYSDVIFGHFGVTPQEGPNRAIYLGSYRVPVNIGEVVSSAESYNPSTKALESVLGDHVGKASAQGVNHVFNKTFTEHGIVLGITSINVPRALNCFRRSDLEYTKGTRANWMWSELDSLGDEPVRVSDVKSAPSATTATELNTAILGYNERYWYEKSMRNEVHGDFANPSSSMFSYTACQYFSQGAESLDLHQINTIDYQSLEQRLFSYSASTINSDPVYFHINNICGMSRPISAHSTPMV